VVNFFSFFFGRWASIALTTVLIRGVTIPILLNQLKATYKLNVLRPQLEELRQEMSTKVQSVSAPSLTSSLCAEERL
jgi:membrane protein insertase Oxa1/YidC/SpoIIIJ